MIKITCFYHVSITTFLICHYSTASFDSLTTTYTEDMLVMAWRFKYDLQAKVQLHTGTPQIWPPRLRLQDTALQIRQGNSIQKWPSSSTSTNNHGYPKFNSAEGWRLCRWHQTEIRRWRRGEASSVANLPHRTKRPVNPPGNQPSRYPVKSMTTGLGRLCRVLSV